MIALEARAGLAPRGGKRSTASESLLWRERMSLMASPLPQIHVYGGQ